MFGNWVFVGFVRVLVAACLGGDNGGGGGGGSAENDSHSRPSVGLC